MSAFPEQGFEIQNKKKARLYFVFVEILYHERLVIVNKGN